MQQRQLAERRRSEHHDLALLRSDDCESLGGCFVVRRDAAELRALNVTTDQGGPSNTDVLALVQRSLDERWPIVQAQVVRLPWAIVQGDRPRPGDDMRAADRGREIRRRLLAATAELIPELGWSGVSTRVVAARAGVAASLVHYHFPSIDVLRREATINALTELLDTATSTLDQVGSVEAGLSALLDTLHSERPDGSTSLLFVEAYLAATRDDVLRDQLSRLAEDFRQTLARLLEDNGVALPESSAVVLAAALDGLMLHRALDPELTSQGVGTVLIRLLERQS